MKNYNKLYKEIYDECPREGSVYPSLYNVEAIFDRGEWKEKAKRDNEQLSLDILTLVSSAEFKSKKFIYEKHNLIKDELNK